MNAVIYARYSSQAQNEQSIEGQLRECHAFAEREGYTIVNEYIDRARTGRSDDRPEFQRMIKDAERKRFRYVIVWKMDRFARNRYDSAIYKARLKKHGVKVLSAMEKIGDSPEGIILEGLLESLAEFYSANLSQNVKRGQHETMEKGKWCGGTIPYGYKVADGRLIADERTAPVIKYVFEQYAVGVRKKDIIDALNEKGYRNQAGNPLTSTAFARALTNTAYMGKYIWGGREIPDCAEQLVDEKTFRKVQERIRAVSRAPAAAKAKVEYQLQGKVFCGHCGSRMIGESAHGRGGVIYTYYTCSARKKSRTCDKKPEKKDFLEWYVVEQTLEYVLAPDRISGIAESVVAQYDKEFSTSVVSDMENQLNRLDKDLNALVDSLMDTPKSARQRIIERMESLEAQRLDLEADLASMRIAAGIRYTQAEIEALMRTVCDGDPLDPDFRRRIIDTFVNAIYLYDDRTVIFYNLRDAQQVSYIGLSEALDDLDDSAPPGSVFDASGEPRVGAKSAPLKAGKPLRGLPVFRTAPLLLLSGQSRGFARVGTRYPW